MRSNFHSLQDIYSESTPSQATASGNRSEILSDNTVPDAETSDPRTNRMPKDTAILKEYCEEIAHQANLLVICRRKIPKMEITNMAPKEMSRQSRHSHRRRSLSDSSGDDSSNGDQESSSDDGANDAGAPAFSDASSLKSAASAASSDTLRSASEDNEGSDENSSDIESGIASSLSDDFEMVSNSEESSDGLDLRPPSEDTDEGDASGSDSRSLLSVDTSDSSDAEVHDTLIDGEDKDLGSHYEYPVGITGQPQAHVKNCDSCGETQQQTWYHCAVCNHSNYDICHDCVKMGQWCLNKGHQLYEEVSEVGVVSVISWSHFVIGQEVLIFDTASTMEKPIFTHSLSERATLHQSAPIIHPLVPLVVWPICAEKLLFADTSRNTSNKKRSFSLQPFKATSSKGTLFFLDLL